MMPSPRALLRPGATCRAHLLFLTAVASFSCSLPELSPSPDAGGDAAPRDAVHVEDASTDGGPDGDVVHPTPNCGVIGRRLTPVWPGSCTFALPIPPASHLSRSAIDVLFDGTKIPMDDASGWVYTDPEMRSIELRGDVCAAFQENPDLVVEILFRCLLLLTAGSLL